MSEVAPYHPRPKVPTAERRAWWREVGAGAALVLADLVAFSWILSHQVSVFSHQHDDVGHNVNFFLASDLAPPVQLWVWLLVVGNGALLCVRRRTRRAGAAILLAVSALALFLATTSVVGLLLWANEV